MSDALVRQIVAANVPVPAIDYDKARELVESVMAAAFPSTLSAVSIAGSVAKGTHIAGESDLDLFISFQSNAGPLADVYSQVRDVATRMSWAPREQNVSIGTTIGGFSVDLVPGRIQPGYRVWHSLYRAKARTWVQTNVSEQIQHVRNSGHVEHVRAMKLWRRRYGVPIGSFALELAVIRACHGLRGGLANDLLSCLQTIGAAFDRMRLEDPANTNNDLQDDLTAIERQQVMRAAQLARQSTTWAGILGGP